MKKEIIFLIFLINYCTCFSQVELTGQLISERTKRIPNEKNIYGKFEDSRKIYTDSLGKFVVKNLENNKKYNFEINSIEFGTVKFSFETSSENILSKTFELKADCEFSSETAKLDWKNKTAKLLLIGSIAPIANSKADKRFEKKYKIQYYDFGCVIPPIDCIIQYNETIIKLLDENYDNNWRSNVRKDVVLK
jgi:hypothetical protein